MDWDHVFSVVPDNMNDDLKDQLFDTVTWYDLDTEHASLEQSRALLRISQELLKYKGEQVETLLHELDEIALKQGEEEAKKIESDTEVRSSRSRKSSAIEIENLEQRYDELKSKYKKQQRTIDKYNQEINTFRKKVKTLEREKTQLEHELQSTKQDGSESSEMSDTIKDHQRELVETVHNKNKQLSDLLHDIEEVEKENVVLREKLANVRDELSAATGEIQNQTERLAAAEIQLKDTDDAIKKIAIDNELLQEEIQELTNQKSNVEAHLMEFTEEINKRIEEWQKVLQEKDTEIEDLKAKSSEASGQSSSPSNSFDEGQPHISALQKLLSERDAQLMDLQSKLEEAVKEMDASTEVIETLKKEVEEEVKRNVELHDMRKELKKQLKLAHERGQKLQEEVDYSEKLAECKSDELKQIIEQLKEDGHLDEAQIVEEIEELRSLHRINEKQISNLVRNINKLQDNYEQMERENSFLRDKLGIHEEDTITLPSYQSKQKQYKKELLRLKRKILKYEEENINLRTEVKNLNRMNSLLQEQLVESAEMSKKSQGAAVSKEIQKTAEQHSIDELDRVIDAEMSLSIGEVAPAEKCNFKEKKMFEEEIKTLCEENEALRNGMHEILNSLNAKKESSLREIKSETFEKLLRALDVKHISGWYHPAMRLQAEVHNMEGVNRELREQLRISRMELEELRNEKQETLIQLSKRSSVSSPRHLVHSSTLKDIKNLDDLNENVDHLIERNNIDAQVCQEIATKMEQFNNDFFVVEKQLEDLYKQSLEDKRVSEDKIAKLEIQNSELDRNVQALDAKLKVFTDDETVDDAVKEIAELTGENVRAYLKQAYLEAEYGKMQARIETLRNDLLKSETEYMKRTSEWSGNNNNLRNKIKILEIHLERAVDFEEHQKVKKDLENLTVKFRELMDDCKRQSENNSTEMDLIKRSRQMSDHEKNEFKNKLNECLSKMHSCTCAEVPEEKLQSLAKRLSECEVDVMGERQRANHINNLYELVKDQLNKSEERFKEYENYTKDVMHKNLILQGHLKDIEDKQCTFVDVELYNDLKVEQEKAVSRADDLASQVGKLLEEKQISEAIEKTTSLWSSLKEDELLALKHQIVDLLSDSDNKAVIARISADLLQTRANEADWKNKYDILSGQLTQCHDEWLDSLRMLDEEKARFEGKEKHLTKKNRVIQDLLESQKLQYYGSIPLISEQRFIDNMKLMLENNHASFLSLYNAQNLENESIILKEQTEVEKKHCLESKGILGDNQEEIQKLLDWLQEKKHIELDLIRFRRQAEFKELQLKQCNERIQIQNQQIAKLEEDLFLSYKDFDIKSLPFTKPSQKSVPDSSGKPMQLNRSQSVQTDDLWETPKGNTVDDVERWESLRAELMNTRKELESKEEILQQLKIKLAESEMNVSLFRTQMGDKQAQITFYEKHILELQQSKKEEDGTQRGQDCGSGSCNLSNGNNEDPPLNTTIKTLQDTISMKEESILHYQSLLKEDRDNHSLAAARMQEEVKLLKIALAEEKQKRMEYEDPAGETQRSKAAIEQYVKQVHALEEHADELHTQVSTLESQLQASRQEGVRWRSLANDRLKGIDDMRQSLEEQHKSELNIYKKDSAKWQEEVLSLKDLINKHKNKILQVQPDLQNILKAKDNKIQELTTFAHQLRDELNQKVPENEAYRKLAEMDKIYQQLLNEHEALKKRFDILLARERNTKEEIRDLKGQLLKTKRPTSSAKSEKSEKSIKEQLQKKVNTLEDEVDRLKEDLAAQVAVNESHRTKIAEDFDRWKKQKQSQQTIEKLKSKLKEKDGEIEKFQQTFSGYRSLIDRLEREKHSLENRIKALKTNVSVYGLGNAHQQNEMLTAENTKLSSEIEELRARLEMHQRHAGGLGAAMMQEKLEAQERKLAVLELSGKGTVEIRAELERLQSTVSNLQKSNLFLEAKNIELKMDLEKSHKDFPRFKEQIQHLENYIEVLKSERETQLATSSSTAPYVPHSSQDSRRVPELERTVLVLKRVVEKLQLDNKRLLGGKRLQMERNGSGEKLRRDFNRLREKYNESVQKISELENELKKMSLKLKSQEDRPEDADFLSISNELNRVRMQLDQKAQLLDRVKVLLHRAATKEKTLLKEIADLKLQLDAGK